jgi:WD40 repeat protein
MNETLSLKDKFTKSLTLKELTGHKKRVYTLDWNSSGNKLASGSVDNSIRVLSSNIDLDTRIGQRN